MTIIPAPIGFRLVRTYSGDNGGNLGDDPIALSETVIAFAFHTTETNNAAAQPIPITPTGTPDPERPWLLIHPDGKLSMRDDDYESFAAWKADLETVPWR